MTSQSNFKDHIDSIIDAFYDALNNIGMLEDEGLDHPRAQRLEQFASAIDATILQMIEYLAQFPDLKPNIAMSPKEEQAYRQGRIAVLPLRKPDTDPTNE
jgi:hypothetical protein